MFLKMASISEREGAIVDADVEKGLDWGRYRVCLMICFRLEKLILVP